MCRFGYRVGSVGWVGSVWNIFSIWVYNLRIWEVVKFPSWPIYSASTQSLRSWGCLAHFRTFVAFLFESSFSDGTKSAGLLAVTYFICESLRFVCTPLLSERNKEEVHFLRYVMRCDWTMKRQMAELLVDTVWSKSSFWAYVKNARP